MIPIAKKSGLFIRQSVIGFGFLSGLFTAIGIDPEEAIIEVAGRTIHSFYPDPGVSSLFVILPTILLLISIWTAYRFGGVIGLASVVLAYFAGLGVFVSLYSAALLLAASVALGYFATNRRLLKTAGLR